MKNFSASGVPVVLEIKSIRRLTFSRRSPRKASAMFSMISTKTGLEGDFALKQSLAT